MDVVYNRCGPSTGNHHVKQEHGSTTLTALHRAGERTRSMGRIHGLGAPCLQQGGAHSSTSAHCGRRSPRNHDLSAPEPPCASPGLYIIVEPSPRNAVAIGSYPLCAAHVATRMAVRPPAQIVSVRPRRVSRSLWGTLRRLHHFLFAQIGKVLQVDLKLGDEVLDPGRVGTQCPVKRHHKEGDEAYL